MKTEKEKMLAGELYNAMDPELVAGRRRCRLLLKRLAPGDRISVGVFDESLAAPLAWTDAEGADRILARAAPGSRGTDAAAALRAARDLLARSPRARRRAVVGLGDGAAHMLPSPAPSPAEGASVLGLRMPALDNSWVAEVRPAPGSSAKEPKLEVRVAAPDRHLRQRPAGALDERRAVDGLREGEDPELHAVALDEHRRQRGRVQARGVHRRGGRPRLAVRDHRRGRLDRAVPGPGRAGTARLP